MAGAIRHAREYSWLDIGVARVLAEFGRGGVDAEGLLGDLSLIDEHVRKVCRGAPWSEEL